MTRTRSKRRKAPPHPSATGIFHPITVRDSSRADRRRADGSFHSGGDPSPADGRQEGSAGNQHVDGLPIGKANLYGAQPQVHTCPTCPHRHHHMQLDNNGKDGSSPRKTSVSKRQQAENAKPMSKSQVYTPYMAARAKELKEDGNRLFQQMEYATAMDQYELALKLIPLDCPDRAIFHSNRAACLMQMKPVRYEAAIHECNLALAAHPRFPRALLRRARAFEATGKLELALKDVELLLEGDVSHPDAIEMARRVRLCLENAGSNVQQGVEGTLSTTLPPADEKLPAEMVATAKPESRKAPLVAVSVREDGVEGNRYFEDDGGLILTPVPRLRPSVQMQATPAPCPEETDDALLRSASCEPSQVTSLPDFTDCSNACSSDPRKVESLKNIIHEDSNQSSKLGCEPQNVRPLKLIYDHDIRLAQMPAQCTFSTLRKLVRERFPSSKSILIKYKDAEGDLVTITSTHDLRLAEAAAAIEATSRGIHTRNIGIASQAQQESVIGVPIVPSTLHQLRFYVMEVPADQEPDDKEKVPIEEAEDLLTPRVGREKARQANENLTLEKKATSDGLENFDQWLVDFAQLFKAHLGIDPNGHIDLHEGGMKLCVQALEGAIDTEDAHKLFNVAGSKFQEMVALGFLNWGNAYMCAARKQLPRDDSKNSEMDFCDRLQAAFDWAQGQYALAEKMFVESIHVKPDFCDAMLSLGHKDFESAKLHWSLAIAKQVDLNSWDSSEMLNLFCEAENTLQEAAALIEQDEHGNRSTDSFSAKMQDAGQSEVKDYDDQIKLALEQDVTLKSQVYLFWGNILYEHSQVNFRLGLSSWKHLLDAAVEKFESAGASPSDVSMALQKHLSNIAVLFDINDRETHEEGKIDDTKQLPHQNIAVDFLTENNGES